MRRVVRPARPNARLAMAATAALALLVSVAPASPAAAQEVPPCDGDTSPGPCRLPDWPDAAQADVPSPFGDIDGVVWIDDEQGDAPAAGLDIQSVGLGHVDIVDPGSLRKSDALIKLGGRKKAVTKGAHVLVRIVLDRPLDAIDDDGHAGVHVATDVDGSRANNVPAGAGQGDNPFAGMQDVYSLTYAAPTGKSRLLKSNLARRWYKAKDPYAAMWAAPNILDMVIAKPDFGDDFRVVTFVSGPDGGYDHADLGAIAIPVDGRVGFVVSCIEGSISTQPFTVRRLVENGQTLRDVEAPASWRGGASFPIQGADREAIQALIEGTDDDGDGVTALASTVSLFEDGEVIRQRPDISLRLMGDEAQVWLELGLTRRGYDVVRGIDPQPTGDEVADVWLARATDAMVGAMPAFRVARKAGPLAGQATGDCIAALAPSAAAQVGAAKTPASAVESPEASASPVAVEDAESA